MLQPVLETGEQRLDGPAPVTDHRTSLGGEHVGMDLGRTG